MEVFFAVGALTRWKPRAITMPFILTAVEAKAVCETMTVEQYNLYSIKLRGALCVSEKVLYIHRLHRRINGDLQYEH